MSKTTAERPTPELVVFDFDGTLLDSNRAMRTSFERAYRKASPNAESVPFHKLLTRQGRPFKDISRELQWPASLPELFIEESIANISQNKHFPGVRGLLERLAGNGIKLGLFTGKDRTRTVLLLKHFNLEHLFSAIVCGDDPFPGKPSAEGLNHILLLTNSSAERCVFVGDSLNDMKASRAANVEFLAVSWQGHSEFIPRNGVERVSSGIDLVQYFYMGDAMCATFS